MIERPGTSDIWPEPEERRSETEVYAEHGISPLASVGPVTGEGAVPTQARVVGEDEFQRPSTLTGPSPFSPDQLPEDYRRQKRESEQLDGVMERCLDNLDSLITDQGLLDPDFVLSEFKADLSELYELRHCRTKSYRKLVNLAEAVVLNRDIDEITIEQLSELRRVLELASNQAPIPSDEKKARRILRQAGLSIHRPAQMTPRFRIVLEAGD